MELNERMALTVEGQVTWADPAKNAKCITCKNVGKHPKPKLQREHICQLVFVFTRKKGLPFDAKRAVGCSKYEQRELPA